MEPTSSDWKGSEGASHGNFLSLSPARCFHVQRVQQALEHQALTPQGVDLAPSLCRQGKEPFLPIFTEARTMLVPVKPASPTQCPLSSAFLAVSAALLGLGELWARSCHLS